MLIPKIPSYFARFTFSTKTSTPRLLKPFRLIIPSASKIRNWRGLGLPSCANGVTVPTSIKPKPSFPKPSIASPFLSAPAARPIGFLNFSPITSTGLSGVGKIGKGSLPAIFSAFIVNSCALSGCIEKMNFLTNEYINIKPFVVLSRFLV